MSEGTDMTEILDKNLEDLEIQEVLKNGTDLREYALQIDKNIKEAEKSSVADYLKESENIASLHNQIEDCDSILARMESMLLVFQVEFLNEINKPFMIPNKDARIRLCYVFV